MLRFWFPAKLETRSDIACAQVMSRDEVQREVYSRIDSVMERAAHVSESSLPANCVGYSLRLPGFVGRPSRLTFDSEFQRHGQNTTVQQKDSCMSSLMRWGSKCSPFESLWS